MNELNFVLNQDLNKWIQKIEHYKNEINQLHDKYILVENLYNNSMKEKQTN